MNQRHNGHQTVSHHRDTSFEGMSAGEIQHELDEIRREMSATISEMERDLKPSQIMARAIDRIQEGGAGEFSHNLSRTVVENPVPVVLVGIGLAWLAGASRQQDVGASEETRLSGAKAKAKGRAKEAKGRAIEAKDRAKDRAKEAIGSAQHAIGGAGERARDLSVRGREVARRGASRARSTWEEQPLLVGILAAAAGVALASAIPQTRRERQIVGPHRERLMERGRGLLEEGKEAVREAGQTAKETLEQPAAGTEEQEYRTETLAEPSPTESSRHQPSGYEK